MKTHEKTIVLHTYPDMLEAKMIQDILQENNIDSFLNDENVMGMDPVGGTELRIFEEDKEAAEKIVTARRKSTDETVKQA
ncbi:MAG: DUF2007 domain-containing protein [Chitinophagaceae bacterium]|nr:DUF2007 domain-containing protein [Chitinophagaceae bacterium]MBK8951718.1 DUF2007 domain-containing protein [Chitinophagaceae bacterium]